MPHLLKRVFSTRRPMLAPVMIGALAVASVGAMAATPDTYQVKTTSDLVTLCSTDSAAADYATAISFCHGFAVGAYQYHTQITGAPRAPRFVCLPNPPPTRTQAIADFVAWARSHPETMNAPPVDSMFKHLGERYPCRS